MKRILSVFTILIIPLALACSPIIITYPDNNEVTYYKCDENVFLTIPHYYNYTLKVSKDTTYEYDYDRISVNCKYCKYKIEDKGTLYLIHFSDTNNDLIKITLSNSDGNIYPNSINIHIKTSKNYFGLLQELFNMSYDYNEKYSINLSIKNNFDVPIPIKIKIKNIIKNYILNPKEVKNIDIQVSPTINKFLICDEKGFFCKEVRINWIKKKTSSHFRELYLNHYVGYHIFDFLISLTYGLINIFLR
jgi:hypothetical protein